MDVCRIIQSGGRAHVGGGAHPAAKLSACGISQRAQGNFMSDREAQRDSEALAGADTAKLRGGEHLRALPKPAAQEHAEHDSGHAPCEEEEGDRHSDVLALGHCRRIEIESGRVKRVHLGNLPKVGSRTPSSDAAVKPCLDAGWFTRAEALHAAACFVGGVQRSTVSSRSICASVRSAISG